MTNPFLDETWVPPPKTPTRKKKAENVERDSDIADSRRNGLASLQDLATKYGISRERVRQIQERAGVSNHEANVAYQKRKDDQEFQKANEADAAILMRYIGGESISDIAHNMGLQVKSVREVLDEQLTDTLIATRSRNIVASLHPNAVDGPREQVNEVSARRQWTEERCMEALCNLARANNGLLPSSTQYTEYAKTRDELPSFPTVRNRLGRWSAVRADVHTKINQENT